MQSVRSGSILVAAMALVLAACTGPDTLTDPATSFTATLTGAQEVPSVATTASGTGTFTAAGAYNITYTGLSGDATMAHIHLGNAGSNGAAAVTLCDGTCPTGAAATITGTATYAQNVIDAMRTFGAYANVHTAAHTGGEIRGQIFGVY
jgi:hypothetical protein